MKCRWAVALRNSVFLVLVVFAANCVAQKMPASNAGPSVAPAPVIGNPAEYAGIDRCRSCHKPEYREYEKTVHAKISVPGKDYVSGCEACHGPGKAHADAIEAAEGDEGKTRQAVEEHPIFSFAVNQKIDTALKEAPMFQFRSTAKENAARACSATPAASNRTFSNTRRTWGMASLATNAIPRIW